jgi:hypothetical protein
MTNVFGGSGKAEGRDGWCTPKWLAELIGMVHLDPATNPRSHIDAHYQCMLEDEGDGLHLEGVEPGAFRIGNFVELADEDCTTFINCGYNRGEVERWVSHYGHTRFVFLLKWSPDTQWFSRLLPLCDYVWFPLVRVDFEPPPGVEASSNPLPHALYLRKPSDELLTRLRGAGWLLRVTPELLDWVSANWHTWKHEHRRNTRSRKSGTPKEAGARRRRGKVRDAGGDGDAGVREAERPAAVCGDCGEEGCTPCYSCGCGRCNCY